MQSLQGTVEGKISKVKSNRLNQRRGNSDMTKKNICSIIIVTFLMFFWGLNQDSFSAKKGGWKMQILSSVFTEGSMIPAKFTCDGQDISPPLEWKNAPAGTKSFALICDDPDAPVGTWVHWVAYNIPPNMNKLGENVKPEEEFNDGMRQGSNSWLKIGYGGPCPPSGTHRYYFTLFALDTMLELQPGATKKQVLQAMKGHVFVEVQLMGKYKRQR
jgi:Raf kinase inhibitor-like YbhB/YbcL family protein